MKTRKAICILILLAIFAGSAFCGETGCVVTIFELKGAANILRVLGDNDWIPAKIGMCLEEGDIFVTKPGSRSLLQLCWKKEATSILIAVKAESELRFAELMQRQKTGAYKILLDLAIGKILIKARHFDPEKSVFAIKTPSTVIKVHGAIFTVEVEPLEESDL